MKTPIIEIRQDNLFALAQFDGTFVDGFLQTRRNLVGNRLCHVIDSNGDLWTFAFADTNHVGLRRLFSTVVWNISHDRYAYAKHADISVARFRELVGPHEADIDPDHAGMASALLESVAACDPGDPLRRHVPLLNL